MKDFVTRWLGHALHWAVLYGAFVAHSEGAMYILKFVVWAMVPMSLFLLADESIAGAAKKPPMPFYAALGAFQAWATLGLLVWFGHIASAIAWLVVIVMVFAHRSEVCKARARLASAT